MASAQPLRAHPTPAAAPVPRSLRLLEKAPPVRQLPPPATWHVRLGHWVDRLLAP